jgi:hypothetical protein
MNVKAYSSNIITYKKPLSLSYSSLILMPEMVFLTINELTLGSPKHNPSQSLQSSPSDSLQDL